MHGRVPNVVCRRQRKPCNCTIANVRLQKVSRLVSLVADSIPCVGSYEAPFGTLKMRMGATHFLMKTLPKVASEMALSVLAYNLTRVMNIVGTRALLAAIRA